MLEEKVEAFLAGKSIHFEGKSILAGVSGGPDSMALLHYLWENHKRWKISLAVAHVDHMFRGDESLEDALYVEKYCKEHSIPFQMARINVPELIIATKANGQEAARNARYGFFKELMENGKYDYLALAHHGDDQVETILMRLTRGSSGKGRAGIPFSRCFGKGLIIRPFLCATREDIWNYCERKGIAPRLDPSNQKDVYSRNRFRKEVLPFLKRENPHIHEHFQRFSEELQSDEEFLDELAAGRMDKVMTSRKKQKVEMDILAFLGMPMPLQRRGIKLILNYLYEERPASLAAIHIDQVIDLINRPHPSGKLDLPGGLIVTRSYLQCIFHFEQSKKTPFKIPLNGPGETALPNGSSISIELCSTAEPPLGSDGTFLPVSDLTLPLIARTKENGDRMGLKGMDGTRKLKDIFIDNKVPVSERENWPVITDSNGLIVWLPGLKKSNLDSAGGSLGTYLKLLYKKEPTFGGHMEYDEK